MYRAFGYNLREEDETAIKEMVASITPESPEISDLRCVEPESKEGDTVFVFGDRALRLVRDLPHKIKLEFPDITKLDADFGEEEERVTALEKLQALKQTLEQEAPETVEISDVILTEEDMRKFDSGRTLQMLIAACVKKGVSSWIGTLRDGRTIRLTVEPEMGKADVNMTFAEIYHVATAMEALQIKELQIVYKPGSTRKGSS